MPSFAPEGDNSALVEYLLAHITPRNSAVARQNTPPITGGMDSKMAEALARIMQRVNPGGLHDDFKGDLAQIDAGVPFAPQANTPGETDAMLQQMEGRRSMPPPPQGALVETSR